MKRFKRAIALVAILVVASVATFLLSRYEEKKEQIKSSDEIILEIPSDTVTALSWELEETSLAFHKGDEGWLYDEDEAFPVSEEKVNGFCKNLFSDIKIIAGLFPKGSPCMATIELYKSIEDDVNVELLGLKSKSDFLHMFEILLTLSRDTIVELFLDISKYEVIKAKYLNKLELLKRGFEKKELLNV